MIQTFGILVFLLAVLDDAVVQVNIVVSRFVLYLPEPQGLVTIIYP